MTRHAHRSTAVLSALLALVLAPSASAAAHPPLRTIDEWGALHMRSSKGATIDEHGSGWGTFRCSASIELRVSGVLVLASYLAECRGGAMKGSARARIRSATTRAAAFSGSITLEGGTGSYAGASGKASFSGTINRTSYAMSLHIAGRVRL